MKNFTPNLNFMPVNHPFYQISMEDWFYHPYFYWKNHYIQNFDKSLNIDESSSAFFQPKTYQKNEIISIQSVSIEENTQNKEKINIQCELKPKDDNYQQKSQKGDRNLNSIVIRNFVNFINSHPSLVKTLEKIIEERNIKITAIQYKDAFKQAFPQRLSYIGVGKLKSFIDKGQHHRQIKLITLVLLNKFINIDFFTVMINSKKVSREAKQKELKHGKKFWREFLHQYQ